MAPIPRLPLGELARAPEHVLLAVSRCTVSEPSPALTGAGGTIAPPWRSSTPRSWLPPFVAPLTFPSAPPRVGRLCRTSAGVSRSARQLTSIRFERRQSPARTAGSQDHLHISRRRDHGSHIGLERNSDRTAAAATRSGPGKRQAGPAADELFKDTETILAVIGAGLPGEPFAFPVVVSVELPTACDRLFVCHSSSLCAGLRATVDRALDRHRWPHGQRRPACPS